MLEATANSSKDDIGAAEAALEAARLNLEFTQVRSPIDGRVSRMLITPGNLVGNDERADDRRFGRSGLRLLRCRRADLPALRAPRRRQRQARSTWAWSTSRAIRTKATLDFVDNQVDPRSGTIHARAVFANKDGRYTPGLFARIKLVGGDTRDTVLIDERAVGTDLGKKFVLALKKDNTLEYRPVTLGANIDGLRVVNQGLAAGDVIVVNGLQHVRPGAAVTPTRVTMEANRRGGAAGAGDSAPVGQRKVASTLSDRHRSRNLELSYPSPLGEGARRGG